MHDDGDDGVAQDGIYTSNSGLTEEGRLGLL